MRRPRHNMFAVVNTEKLYPNFINLFQQVRRQNKYLDEYINIHL